MTNMLARAHKATGDLVCAVVLLRIGYRYDQAVKAGREWTAQSYEDLMEETGCSWKQVKRAIAKLKEAEFIVCRQGLFANRNVNHFQLTNRAVKALEGHPEKHLEGQPELAPQGQLYIQGETTGSIYKEELACSSEHATGDDLMPTMQELVSGAKVGPNKKETVKSEHAVMESVWKHGVFPYTNIMVPPLTAKQHGQLKMFSNACPPGTAKDTLAAVLADWTMFTATVKSDAGIASAPAIPNMDFLLKHVFTAIKFSKPVPTVENLIQTPLKVAGDVVKLTSQGSGTVSEKPMTLEEMEKILSGD